MSDHEFIVESPIGKTPVAALPGIVTLGSVVAMTGKQPRGHKADGGAAGGDYKDGSESPHE